MFVGNKVWSPRSSEQNLALLTPSTCEVGRHQIEGLKNPTVVRDLKALEVFPIRPVGVKAVIEAANESLESYPGRQPS